MKYGWLLVFAFMICGCQQFHDKPLNPAKTLHNFESRTLDQPELVSYIHSIMPGKKWPPARWDLPSLTLVGFYYHPEMELARSRLKIAQADMLAAGQRPNPSLSLIPAFNTTTPASGDISPWIFDSSIDIPFQTAGKRRYRIAQARHLSEAAGIKIAEAAWQVRHQIRMALLSLYKSQEEEKLLQEREKIQAENAALLQKQQEFGQVIPFQTYQARIALHTTRLRRLDLQQKQQLARRQLAEALGVTGKIVEDIPLSFASFEHLPGVLPSLQIRRRALLNRSDLLAALAEYRATQSALQLEIARQYPDINIGPGYTFDQSENKWALGVSLTLPVFNQNQGLIAQARARRDQAAARFKALQATILAQIEQAVNNYQTALLKVQALEKIVAEQTRKTRTMQKMFAIGEIPKQEVLANKLETNSNLLLLQNARFNTLEAFGQLEDAIQIPTDLPNWQNKIPPGDKHERGT